MMEPEARRGERPTYRKPYPAYIDQIPLSPGFKVPNFTLFNREDPHASSVEHIGRFSVQCRAIENNPLLKLRLFGNSLSGQAFTCHISDLAALKQSKDEPAQDFITRFRKLKMKCRIFVEERHFIQMAQAALKISLRKRFDGMLFGDLAELADKASKYEELLREEQQRRNSSKGTYYKTPSSSVHLVEVESEEEAEESQEREIVVAEMAKDVIQEGITAGRLKLAEKPPSVKQILFPNHKSTWNRRSSGKNSTNWLIKHYLSNPPVLSPPKKGKPLKPYVFASEVSIGSLLVQDNKERKEQAVYYMNRTLTEVKRKYSAIEGLYLALFFTAVKLRHYMLPYTIYIITKTDQIKYMLTRPMLRGRIGKWTLALTEFAFKYVPQKAVKGQVVADFLADHPGEEIENMDSLDIANANLLTRVHTCLNNPIYSVHLTPWKLYFDGSKTDIASGAEIVLEELLGIRHLELGIQSVEILGDSMLVLKQIVGGYKCLSPYLAVYQVVARNLLTKFREATREHIPREENFAANELTQMEIDVNSTMITEDDWRNPIITYLQYPTLPSEKRVRIMAMNYLVWNEDLVRKSKDEVLLRCLGRKEYMKVMGETHEGICGAHQGGRKMCWLIRRYGYLWPTMMKDCIDYSKGMGNGSHWQDLPSQQHCFIIVATDYFTKWVEAKLVKSTTSQEIITFIEEQIIQRFGIPESITTDRGSSFISGEMLDMTEAFKFKLLQSTPYYAQANGQAESSNKAYRTSKREATGMTPYALTYGHDAILPMEIAVKSLRIILGMGAYKLQDRDGEVHVAPINGKWLKKFFPTMWDSQPVQTDPGIEKGQY
ncbi:unnamed protein product [Prunus armeniaca]